MSITDRQRDLVLACKQPRTIEELSKQFDASDKTIRRDLYVLESMGIVREYTFRKNRFKRYISVLNPDQRADAFGTANINLNGTTYAPVDFLNMQPSLWLSSLKSSTYAVAKLLAEYGEKMNATNENGLNVISGYPDLKTFKAKFRESIEILEGYVLALQQLYDLPCWEDIDLAPLLFGKKKVNWDKVIDINIELGERAANWK